MVYWFIIAGVVVWVGATLFALFRKEKMLALVLFFSIPVAVMFVLVLVMIVLVSMRKSIG